MLADSAIADAVLPTSPAEPLRSCEAGSGGGYGKRGGGEACGKGEDESDKIGLVDAGGDNVGLRPSSTGTGEETRVRLNWTEDFCWGRSFARFVGEGYMPPSLAERLERLDLLEQLFVLRREMQLRIHYELGARTVRRPAKNCGMNRGMNQPVTYASNIWNRGYANCAGHCVIFAAALQKLGVPYCIVGVRSPKPGVSKHAIMEVGFPEDTDTWELNRRAAELWAEYYGSTTGVRRRPELKRPEPVKLFAGLKITHSAPGSEAARRKGVGHWLWVDPQSKIGSYAHLIFKGYLVQSGRGLAFALKPRIKTWREIASPSPGTEEDGGDDAGSSGGEDCNFKYVALEPP